ncbi:MAG: gamma-glutamyltransferase [Bacteroidota bacterium]|jgi:gamma-glutamyltranspeptidase/glutathione hydrolase
MMRLIAGMLLFSTLCLSVQAQVFNGTNQPFKYTVTKKMVTNKGAVVSAHPLASEAGLLILKKGGNAIDAAIATQLALAVVYPNAGNIGGGGFLVAQLVSGECVSLDYREMAPSLAHRDMYIDSNGVASTQKSQNGHLASGVPGTVAGLFASHRYAKLPFAKLIEPAIELAEKGFVITESEARSLNYLQSDLKKYNTVLPAFYRTTPWKAGDTLIQSDLAATLKRIQRSGKAGFYGGETAKLIEAEMKRGNGLITQKDLAAYEAKWRTPHEFDYKGYRVVSMPMPSSGGLLLHQMMKMVESRNLGAMGFQTPASVQLMTEVMRRAYADRSKFMGDADFYPVPVSKLTDPEYLKMRMSSYRTDAPTPSSQLEPGNVNYHESEETTHLSVMDSEGNAVAVTTTLNGSYGSKTVVGGAGFFLNNEMDDFSIKPGVANMFGAIGGEANAIHPGKRMLSSMTPTLVLKNNKPYIVVGTPGGTTIPTQVFQALINILEFGMNADDAINKPKFHHQWLPDELVTEKGFNAATLEALRAMGYPIGKERGGIGRTEIILVRPDGKKEAVADRRGDDGVAGY